MDHDTNMANELSRIACSTLTRALTMGPPPKGNLAIPVFSHGSLVVELYAPTGQDSQKPHDRDEVYLVARGNGFLFDGVRRYRVAEGSFLFVPAGEPHFFEDFSADFAVWVIFYGPPGGEPIDEGKSAPAPKSVNLPIY